MNKGYLTAAYTNSIYAEQAVCLVLSFRYHQDNTPISIVVDEKNHQYLTQKNYIKFFDQVIVLPSNQLYQFIGKLYSALKTPYEDTLYFDSDCLSIRKSEELFPSLSSADFCVPGEDMVDGEYAGLNIKEWLLHNKIEYIPIFNAGVFRFNSKGKYILLEALEMMKDANKYKLPKADGGLNEQVALGIAMAKNNIHSIPFTHDYHFSFYNASSPLMIDLENQCCEFSKENILRKPFIFHYTPLYHAGYYYSKSRKNLMIEINKLRKSFGLEAISFFKPKLRDQIALIRKGLVFKDNR